MLDSLAELLIISMLVAWLFRKIRIPELVGILFVGVLFGPYVLNMLDPTLLDVSGELRLGALIVILLRAGLELTRDSLNKVGRPALLLSFIPAIFEGGVVALLAPLLLGLSYLPKATVQAAIGAGPLVAMRLAGMPVGPGETILAVAVLSIIVTAPIGAVAIAITGKRWLS